MGDRSPLEMIVNRSLDADASQEREARLLSTLTQMKTLEAQLDEMLLTDRLIALLSAGFGLLATLLASVGLYGVMTFVVARRPKDLGIRLALGAQPGLVIWLVMREVLLLLAIGLAAGVPAAMALGPLRPASCTASTHTTPRSQRRRCCCCPWFQRLRA